MAVECELNDEFYAIGSILIPECPLNHTVNGLAVRWALILVHFKRTYMNMTCMESGKWDRFVRCRFEGIILKIQKHLYEWQTEIRQWNFNRISWNFFLPIFVQFLFKMIKRSIFAWEVNICLFSIVLVCSWIFKFFCKMTILEKSCAF